MGKITSIYLTDEEIVELKKFCEEHQCTQYSALKTALREILSKPVSKSPIIERDISEETDSAEKIETKPKKAQSQLMLLLKELEKK